MIAVTARGVPNNMIKTRAGSEQYDNWYHYEIRIFFLSSPPSSCANKCPELSLRSSTQGAVSRLQSFVVFPEMIGNAERTRRESGEIDEQTISVISDCTLLL